MSLIHNERAKLTATYINGIAIAIFAVGSFAPALNTSPGSIRADIGPTDRNLPRSEPHTTFDSETVPQEAVMSNLEYLLLTSIAPLGALVIAVALYYGTRRHDRVHPGE